MAHPAVTAKQSAADGTAFIREKPLVEDVETLDLEMRDCIREDFICRSDLDNPSSRPGSNLSHYGARPDSSLAKDRPDSVVSTRWADTPLPEFGENAEYSCEVVSPDELDKMRWNDAAFERRCAKSVRGLEEDPHRPGNFKSFPLPDTPIDDCADTPHIVRQSACLRDRLQARREASAVALGNFGLKSLGHVKAMMEKDVLAHFSMTGTRSTGFAQQMATARKISCGELISKVPLLSLEVVSQDEQNGLREKLSPAHYARGEKVFAEGETGDKLFIVESGTCILTQVVNGKSRTLREIKPGDYFGDMAVMYDMPRSGTVTAATAVKLLSLSREDVLSTIGAESLEKIRCMTRMQLIEATPVFAEQSREQKLLLLKHMRTEVFHPGREVMREDWRSSRTNRRVYIIESGTCTQLRKAILAYSAVLAPGANFGNFEFTFGCPQQSTVVASTEVSVISLGFSEIAEAVGPEADIVVRMMQRSMRLKLLRNAHPKLFQQNEQTLGSVLDIGTFRRFSAWQPIVRKGDVITDLMMLDQGSCIEHDEGVATLMETTNSSMMSTEHSRPGDTFNTGVTIDQEHVVASYTLVAIDVCSVFCLPAEILQNLPSLSLGDDAQ